MRSKCCYGVSPARIRRDYGETRTGVAAKHGQLKSLYAKGHLPAKHAKRREKGEANLLKGNR
jgi:hypothetical protein